MEMEELVWAVKNGDDDVVSDFLVKQPTFNVNGLYPKRTLLHHASEYGQTEVIELLLKKGAQVNVIDSDGLTPLLLAIYEDQLDCAKLLLDHGANKNGKTPLGKSYMETASSPEMKTLLS